MTNGEILKTVDGLRQLNDLKISFNIKTSYQLARNKQILDQIAKTITDKQYEIYKQYGTIEENGDVRVPAEKVPMLNKDLDQLMPIENNVSIIKLTIDDFGDVDIPFDILEKLLPIIEN